MKKFLLGISMISMLESVNVSASSMNTDAIWKNLSQSEKDRLIAIHMASTNSTSADMGQEADNQTLMERIEMQERARMTPKVAETTNLRNAISNCYGHTFHKDTADPKGFDVRIDATVPCEIVRNGSLELGKFIGVVNNLRERHNVLLEKMELYGSNLDTRMIVLYEKVLYLKNTQGQTVFILAINGVAT